MRLSLEVRLAVEGDLYGYRAMRQRLQWYRELQEDCTAAPVAKWSHIGATTGQPGDPTGRRGGKLAQYCSDHDLDECRRVVGAVERWRSGLHRDDRILVALVYGMEREERRTLQEACEALGIPFGDRDERRAVVEHMRDLLAGAATAMGHRKPAGRPPRLEALAEELVAVG